MRNICESIKAELVSYDTGNFTVSIIMRRKDAQMVKIELSDVRRSKNFDMVLIRTFPGGDEEYPSRSTLAHLEDLSNSISKL